MTTSIHYNFGSRIFIITDDEAVQKQYLPPIEFDDHCIITKHLTDDQKIAIRSQQVTREEVDHFAYHFNSKNCLQHMVDNLKDNEKNGMLALRAWHEKLITDEQFFTACYVYSALDQMYIDRRRYEFSYNSTTDKFEQYELSLKPEIHTKLFPPLPVSIHSIFDEPNKNHSIRKYFQGTQYLLPLFLEKLKYAPDSEKSYLVINLPVGSVAHWSPGYARFTRITSYMGPVNRCSKKIIGPYIDIPNPQLLVIPSYSFYKTWFAGLNQNDIRFQPVLGKISKETIMTNLMKGIRVGSINIPGALVPLEADNQKCGRYIFCLHDIYHTIRLLFTAKSHFAGMLKVYEILSNLILTLPEHAIATKAIRWEIMDGENFGRKNDICERFGAIFNTTKIWPKEVKESVLQNMALNKREWKQETTLTIKEHLYPVELEIYRRLRQKIKEDKLL